MKGDGGRELMAEINVTPFVDVMLVLLVIFMVAAPMLDRGINLKLPKASTAKRISGAGPAITLTKDHLIYWNENVVTLKELRDKLGKLQHAQPILIRADRSAYVSRLIELWDLCRDAGFHEVRIATMAE